MVRRKKDEISFRTHMKSVSEACREEGNDRLADALIELTELAVRCQNGDREIEIKDVKVFYGSLPTFSNPYQFMAVANARNLVDHFIGP